MKEHNEEEEQQKLLTAWEAYKAEVMSDSLTDEEEQVLAMQARTDEAARAELTRYCIRFVVWQAAKYTQFTFSYDEYMDLIGTANEGIVKSLDAALTKKKPVAYLRTVIKYRIIDASKYYRDFVRQNISLEELFEELAQLPAVQPQQEHPQARKLREALGGLTEKQRYIVERYFGLDGEQPETLYALDKRLGGSGLSGNATGLYRNALNKLRRILAE